MDDIDAMFSEMLGEMDLLTQVSVNTTHVVLHSQMFDSLSDLRKLVGGLARLPSSTHFFFFHLQSLEQEISPHPPPASEPGTKEEMKLSIGFTDLNGDLTSCPSVHCCKMVTKSCLLKCCTLTQLLLLLCNACGCFNSLSERERAL